MTAPRALASRLNTIATGLLGGDKRTLKEAAECLVRQAAAIEDAAMIVEAALIRGDHVYCLGRIATTLERAIGET